MNRTSPAVLALAALLICCSTSTAPGGGIPQQSLPKPPETPPPELGLVQKIHVGYLGDGDEAERFGILLKRQLEKAGFTTVEAPEKADARLSGILVVRVFAYGSAAYATLTLSSPEGQQLWLRDFGPGSGGFWRRVARPGVWPEVRDGVRSIAERAVKELKADWERARKTSK